MPLTCVGHCWPLYGYGIAATSPCTCQMLWHLDQATCLEHPSFLATVTQIQCKDGENQSQSHCSLNNNTLVHSSVPWPFDHYKIPLISIKSVQDGSCIGPNGYMLWLMLFYQMNKIIAIFLPLQPQICVLHSRRKLPLDGYLIT